MRMTLPRVLVVVVAVAVTVATQPARAQGTPERVKVLRAAADALGMARWSDIGAGTTRLPAIDVVNTMEFQGSGTMDDAGRAVKIQYHVALGYNPPAMRVQTTRPGPESAAAPRSIQTVRESFAWDESEVGAGLVSGKGVATPMNGAARERLLQLWTLPYGVVKAALVAGEKTAVSTEAGSTVITFPLSGPLAGVTVKATLDANSLVTRVETRADSPTLASLATQTEYANYADRAEVLTDIKTPGRIIRRQGGRTLLDLEVKTWETNNPYLVFPVPPNVKTATGK